MNWICSQKEHVTVRTEKAVKQEHVTKNLIHNHCI